MKGGLIILLFCCVTACNLDGPSANSSEMEAVSDQISDTIIETFAEDSIYYTTEMGLDGAWALTSYFDPILKEKTIAKYRGSIPTWFAILLEFKKDTVSAYGSLYEMDEYVSACQSDTLTVFETNWGNWLLLNRGYELHLKLIPNENDADPTTYIYEKRPEMHDLITEADHFKLKTKITEYFNKNLLAGTYISQVKDTLFFMPNGKIIGWNAYDEFAVDVYFGTSHSFKNLDMLMLRNQDALDFYQWEFKKEQLILTEFVADTILYNNEWVEKGDYVLTEKQIRLRGIN
ncbi:MAG: hypothetical protein ACI8ZM_001585 [Crocinitomix sp.]